MGEVGEFLSNIFYSTPFTVIKIVIGVYCLMLLFNIIFLSRELTLFSKLRRKMITGSKEKPEQTDVPETISDSSKLNEVNKKMVSNSPSEWKLAVIEADKILDKILESKGYEGATMGDKLKQLVPADLPEIYDDVWEAHKIRNRIVHEPNFELSQGDVRTVVGIYTRAIKKLS